MKRATSHKINEKGMRLFEASLPENWLANPQNKDYGKDYLVEIGDEDGTLSGGSFYVQLKSHASVKLRGSGEFLSFALQSRHARHYGKIKDLPVFLVLADISAAKCWYLFLQPAIDADQSWKHKRQISVRVPTANDLSNLSVFRQHVLDAKQWLRSKSPGSIIDAVKAREGEIQEIDPRFQPIISFANGNVDILMSAKEQVQFKLRLVDESARSKMVDLIEYGKAQEFESTEISIEGSKLFKHFQPKKITLKPTMFDGVMVISDANSISKSNFRSLEVPLSISGGTKRITLESNIATSPIRAVVNVNIDEVKTSDFAIRFDAGSWEGKPICGLPHFDSAIEIFSFLSQNNAFYLHFLKDGNVIESLPFKMQSESQLKIISRLFENIAKIRCIFDHYKQNPAFKRESLSVDANELDLCYELIQKGNWAGNCSGLELSTKIALNDNIPSHLFETSTHEHLKIESDMTFQMLGVEIPIGRVSQEFSKMAMIKPSRRPTKPRKRRGNPQKLTHVPFVFRAGNDCIHTVRIVDG